MKKITFTIIILFLSVAFIYLKGEVEIEKATDNYLAIGFDDVQQEISPNRNDFQYLNFFINNQNKENYSRKIEFLIDNEKIDEIEVKVNSKENLLIKPTEKIKIYLKNVDNDSIKFSVNIYDGKKKETIEKKVSIN